MEKRTGIRLLIWGLCLTSCIHGTTQPVPAPHRLKMGDTVPDLVYQVRNFKHEQLSFLSLKKKLIILDFWGVWCSSCIASIPKMEKLQREFDADLQIIMVTRDSQKKVDDARAISTFLRNASLPMINGDSILSRFFVYRTVPTHAWIDSLGVVQQITDGHNSTEKNILGFLEKKKIRLPEKREEADFDLDKPLWLEGNGRQLNHLRYYSYIMNSIDGIHKGGQGGESDSISGKPIRLYALNTSILGLYKIAYNGLTGNLFDWDNRCLLRVKHPEWLKEPEDDEEYDDWAASHQYSYDLKLPVEKSNQLYITMRQDLDRFFGFQSRIIKTRVHCLVLKRISATDQIHTRGGQSLTRISEQLDSLTISNQSLQSSLIPILGLMNRNLSTPIIDGTFYKSNIDLNLIADLKDIVSVNNELRRYGLSLVREDRVLDMLMIRDK